MSYKIKINPVKAVTNLGYGKRDIIGPSDKCYSICAAFSSGDDAYNINKDCAKECDSFVEKRRYEVYGVGRCDHQAPYRPVIWDNIPNLVPKFVKKGKSPEEALQLAREMCKNVPNLYNECVDLAQLHYNAIEKTFDSPTGPNTPDAPEVTQTPSSGPNGPVGPVGPSGPVGPVGPSSPVASTLPKENYTSYKKNNILLEMIVIFIIILIILYLLARFKIFVI